MAGEALPALPDDSFRRVLCVVAHPDDVEYGTSAAVARWTARGVEVAYLLLTRGEAGIDGSPPERTAALRTDEEVAAAAAVGVTRVEFLDHPDGVLEYGVHLRRDIARTIRSFQPDVVLVGSWEFEVFGILNQADHRAAGMAAVDAVRDAANRWVFPDQLGDDVQPWSVRWLLVAGDTRSTHGVDVTGEPLERGIASLEAHGAYLAGIPGHPAPRTLITTITSMNGRAMGVPNAVLFRAMDLQAPPELPDAEQPTPATTGVDAGRLLRLWTEPLPEGDGAEAAFREVYADPVTVNGARLSAADLVARARALQATFEAPEREVLDTVQAGSKVALAFLLRGRQVGPLVTSAGQLAPTGRMVTLRVIDILTVADGLITDVVMVADELGALAGVDAVRLVQAPR